MKFKKKKCNSFFQVTINHFQHNAMLNEGESFFILSCGHIHNWYSYKRERNSVTVITLNEK